MNPISWLEHHILGFRELPQLDRDAISHFLFLWSLFEAKALQTNASARRIVKVVHEWSKQGRLDGEEFTAVLDYFRDRYFQNGLESRHFSHLNLRRNDEVALVRAVLEGSNNKAADETAAVLIIVYRLRNNLFHGIKWAYGVEGQLTNFEHANRALMTALLKVQ